MIIMVTPFAAYFYSVYTPLLGGLEQSAATAWLPQFFLPHLAHTKLALFRAVNWVGAVLTLIGLVGFLACAVQLYYGKFVRKRLVTGGLYGRVRHPQYLMLIIAGAGLLLLWPRFFILVTYLMMLGLYYVLARHEEEVIRHRYGAVTDDYLARVPMLNPFAGARADGHAGPLPRSTALAVWLGIGAVSLAAAFGLRALAVSQLYAVRSEAPNVTAVAFRELSDEDIGATADAVMATEPLRVLVRQNPQASLFMQINDGRSSLRHLLIDLGMTPAALDAVAVPRDARTAVVSRVLASAAGGGDSPDAFALGARIEPLFLAAASEGERGFTVSELTAGQFHEGFARILF